VSRLLKVKERQSHIREWEKRNIQGGGKERCRTERKLKTYQRQKRSRRWKERKYVERRQTERERERVKEEWDSKRRMRKKRDSWRRERERRCVCVCVCVYEKESKRRKREWESWLPWEIERSALLHLNPQVSVGVDALHPCRLIFKSTPIMKKTKKYLILSHIMLSKTQSYKTSLCVIYAKVGVAKRSYLRIIRRTNLAALRIALKLCWPSQCYKTFSPVIYECL